MNLQVLYLAVHRTNTRTRINTNSGTEIFLLLNFLFYFPKRSNMQFHFSMKYEMENIFLSLFILFKLEFHGLYHLQYNNQRMECWVIFSKNGKIKYYWMHIFYLLFLAMFKWKLDEIYAISITEFLEIIEWLEIFRMNFWK